MFFERKPTDFLEEIYAQLQPRNDDLIDLIDRNTMAFWGGMWENIQLAYHTVVRSFKTTCAASKNLLANVLFDVSWMILIYVHGVQAGFPSQKNVHKFYAPL